MRNTRLYVAQIAEPARLDNGEGWRTVKRNRVDYSKESNIRLRAISNFSSV